jgi:hypothetical protein
MPGMSFVTAAPEMVASAASDLASIGSSLSEAHAAAAGPTTAVVAAASDEVSAAIASLFSSHAKGFQALGAQAASFHDQFVGLMRGASAQYASAEAANMSQMTTAAQNLTESTPFGNLNFGYGNTGSGNIGLFNTGTLNIGIGNTGSANLGIGNLSPGNLIGPTGNVTVFGGAGLFNNGFNNVGIGNIGNNNTGLPLPLLSLLGVGNTGSFNQGLFNFGTHNIGVGNTGSNLYGIGLTGTNQFGIGPLSIPYPFPPLPLNILYPLGLS